jgi:hypothetical protein
MPSKAELVQAARSLRLLLEKLPVEESLSDAQLRDHLELAVEVLEKIARD